MFRHTYATELLQRQVPAEVVQKLLGHVSVTTTIDTYSHLQISDIRKTLEVAGWLEYRLGEFRFSPEIPIIDQNRAR